MKALRLIGESPFEGEPSVGPKPRIGTLFPADGVLVTLPPAMHPLQRAYYVDFLVRQRELAGLPPWSEEEVEHLGLQAVDLLFPPGQVQIRPEPDAMDLAFQADELLQTRVPKHLIRFLHAGDNRVRKAIKERGELWRICPTPQSVDEIVAHIEQSRILARGRARFYYSGELGTRFLTCGEFARMGSLDDASLALQLAEIRLYGSTLSTTGHPNLAFFPAGIRFGTDDFEDADFVSMPPDALRRWYDDASRRFAAAVPRDLRAEDVRNPAWRTRMFRHLVPDRMDTVTSDLMQNLSPEFHLQIQWLPGARFEDGELIYDSVFDDLDRRPDDPELRRLCDDRVRQFIGNFISEFGALEYVNVGSVAAAIRHHAVVGEAHRAYIAEIKPPDEPRPLLRILRIAKWGIRERLEQDKCDMLGAFVLTAKYLDYTFDRRRGCIQLGMRVPKRIVRQQMPETYHGTRTEFDGWPIWVHYFERDYIEGTATNQIPSTRYADTVFAAAFARLLGEAAAVNLVVGRMSADGRHVIFDDGDEILVEDPDGAPLKIVVADHAGTFVDYETELAVHAPAYAAPVNRRREHLVDARGFAEAYLGGFGDRLRHMKADYLLRRDAFDLQFKNRPQDRGSFAWRWRHVLARLERTDPEALVSAIAAHIVPAVNAA